jgi:hypothetical protein
LGKQQVGTIGNGVKAVVLRAQALIAPLARRKHVARTRSGVRQILRDGRVAQIIGAGIHERQLWGVRGALAAADAEDDESTEDDDNEGGGVKKRT